MRCLSCFACLGVVASTLLPAQTPAPKLITENGRHAMLVDGTPYLVLGAQINNSSAWPSVLPQVWPALEAMHVNTAEAPVYWEQIEPHPGQWDWTSVDALLDGARARHLHLILLWFGTWKNGNDHYAPAWVKEHPEQFPRMRNAYGTPLDVLSANSAANLDADRTAFTALMRHLAERDAAQHTVLMMQVENESGAVGTDRDYSPEAGRAFAGPVPAELVKGLRMQPGTWAEVFPGDAGERFQAWTQARYINAIVEAGKREFAIPMYCNVWLAYPPAELPERQIAVPGIGYPSGGPVQTLLPQWKIAAPALDAIGPDIYSSNASFYLQTLDTYARPDNPLWIPETGLNDAFAPFFFSALGRGAIGFSPFGVDWTGWTLAPGAVAKAHAANYALVGPMDRTLAKLVFDGKVKTAVEAVDGADQELLFMSNTPPSGRQIRELIPLTGAGTVSVAPSALQSSAGVPANPAGLANATVPEEQAGTPERRAADALGAWVAEVRFGLPQKDGAPAPGTKDRSGRMLVAQLGPNEFLLTGVGGAVFFHRPGYLPGIRMQIVSAEEGFYTPGTAPGATETWQRMRLLNGDQDDRGIRFPESFASEAAGKGRPTAVRVLLGRF